MVSRVFSSKEEDQNMCQLLLLLSKIYTGALVLRWIMRQCNEHKKVSEYQRSYKELKIFLRDKWTIDDLGSLCVSAISMFAETLIEKETYLGITCEYTLQIAWILRQRHLLNHKIVL